jgi:hypothetical protein
MDPLRTLLNEMRTDDYVRFKYGKQIDATLKALDAKAGVDAQVLEARLVELLELVRGKKGGGSAPSSKSKRPTPKQKEAAVAHV